MLKGHWAGKTCTAWPLPFRIYLRVNWPSQLWLPSRSSRAGWMWRKCLIYSRYWLKELKLQLSLKYIFFGQNKCNQWCWALEHLDTVEYELTRTNAGESSTHMSQGYFRHGHAAQGEHKTKVGGPLGHLWLYISSHISLPSAKWILQVSFIKSGVLMHKQWTMKKQWNYDENN